MVPRELVPTVIILVALYVLVVVISYWWMRRTRIGLEKKDHEMKQRLYELAILKEISDRTGYSLNEQKILDVIMGSLNQFLEYSAVAYMLLEPSKVVFKADLEKSVSSAFIKNIRERMVGALTALLGRDFTGIRIEETITGAIIGDESRYDTVRKLASWGFKEFIFQDHTGPMSALGLNDGFDSNSTAFDTGSSLKRARKAA